MIRGFWGKKIGMTQVFSEDQKVVPVTAIDVANWIVTQVKTKERDGYTGVQLGCLKNKYVDQKYSPQWLQDPKTYFSVLREVILDDSDTVFEVGQNLSAHELIGIGDFVNVFGITAGKGFQGVVKRHGFSGGRASHGDKMGRSPGALEGQTSCGRVPKGKAMPGHMGVSRRVMKNLEIIKVEPQARVVFVKGSIPGKTGSLVFVQKCKAS